MLKSYFLIAFRNLLKHKTFSAINLFGLATGLACCLLILQYVHYETSYDQFHENIDQLYRVRYDNWQNGRKTFECAAAVPAAGPALKANIPEVENFVRMFPVSGIVSRETPQGDLLSFREDKFQVVDSTIFDIFSFKLIKGNVETALAGPNKVVISERAAKKYFRDEDPIGQNLTFMGEVETEISGVIEDVPENSHIKFDFLISYRTIVTRWGEGTETSWGWYDFNTYVLLNKQADVTAVQAKWDEWLYNDRHEDWEKYNYKSAFILEPVEDIHLYSDLLQESEPDEQGDGDIVYALSIIAIFILIIAWVNYVNLSTARSIDRANEVGVRKALGAVKSQLRFQFLLESLILNGAAMLIALVVVQITLPYFADLTGRAMTDALFTQIWFWQVILVLFLVGTFVSGYYPALVLSSFKPVTVLKGKLRNSSKGILLRKGLVIFQFAASVLLVSGTIIVYQQISHMLNQDLGFSIDQTLVLKGAGIVDDSTYTETFETFKNELLQEAAITKVTSSTNVPGDEIFWTRGIQRLQGGPESSTTIYNVGIDYDYLPTFEIDILAGRNFSRDFPSDNRAVILNESITKILQYETPEAAINEEVRVGGDTMLVVGVLEDYHQMSLKTVQQPMVFRLHEASSSFYALKIQTAGIQQSMERIQDKWNAYFPGNPFDYFFLDDFFNRQYQSEERFGTVFSIFSLLAIFIAGLGLFGLSSFTARQRTKEIGVRKVLGSTVKGVFVLLSTDFVKLVLISNVIAWPLCWWLMDMWLNSFPFRVSISWWIFPIAGLMVLIISLLTVSYQTIRAATANPVKALKYE